MSSALVVLSVGSWEQHGPHLPLDTDTRIAHTLASNLADRVTECVLGPTISVTSSGEHAGFPGTLSIGGPVLVDMLVELARSADWADGLVIVNGHGGNVGYLAEVHERLTAEARHVLIWSPPLVDPEDSHAGYVETSVMLAIDPRNVRTDEIAEGPTLHLDEILVRMRLDGVRSVSPSGVLGNPQRANRELGQQLLSSWTEHLVSTVTAWRDSLNP